MIVAVSAHGPSLDDAVDERFGRAQYLVVVDSERMSVVEAVDNSANRQALQGAGIAAAEIVSRSGAHAVVTGHLGPKAFRALAGVEIPGYEGAGRSVRDAVTAFAAGELTTLAEASSGHMG